MARASTRERQVRRRRVGAAVIGGAVAAAAVAGLLTAFGGGGRKHEAPKAQPRARVVRGVHKRSSGKEAAAVKRFVKLGYPLYCGGHKGKYVALTFDDGPGPYTTQYAFKIFRRFHTRVTWFLVGKLLSTFAGVPRRELAFGPLGDHTWSHAYLPGLSVGQMANEIASAQNAIEKASGRPVTLFRPPYGAHTPAIDAEAKSLGMLEVLWSIDSRDSQGADRHGITKEVLDNLHTGSIVLLHENRGQTVTALRFFLLPALRKRGFKTVTVPQMLVVNPPSVKQLKAGFAGC